MTEQESDVCSEIENGLYEEFNWLFADNSKYVKMINIVENAIDKNSKKLQTQKAIECLKEVREIIYDDYKNCKDLAKRYLLTEYGEGCIDVDTIYINHIDNKIKELEEKANDKTVTDGKEGNNK